MDDVVYQENRLCPIILGHICRWKFLKMCDFMFLQGAGIPQFVILQGGGTVTAHVGVQTLIPASHLKSALFQIF